jgi:hypothetical protein
MKNVKYLLSVAVASALVACSSMDIDDQEALAENFPEDFADSTYLNLHPELVRIQLKDYVTSYNKKLSDSVSSLVKAETAKCLDEDTDCINAAKVYKTAFDSSVAVDTAAYYADTAGLHKILVDRLLGGFTEADWQSDWNVSYTKTDSVITSKDTILFRIDSVAGADTVKIMLKLLKDGDTTKTGEFTYDATDPAKIAKIKGYRYEYKDKKWVSADSTALVEVEMADGMSIAKKNGVETVLDTIGHVIDSVAVSGGLSKDHLKILKALNLYGSSKDFDLLKAVPIDTFAVSYQYVMFGRDHGWAYRRCTEAEKANPSYNLDVFPAEKLYCADEDGLTHEIN